MQDENTLNLPTTADDVSSVSRTLDLSKEVCPMSFVRAKLLVEAMNSGERAEIVLGNHEAFENVSESLRELGHFVDSIDKQDKTTGQDRYRLLIRKH